MKVVKNIPKSGWIHWEIPLEGKQCRSQNSSPQPGVAAPGVAAGPCRNIPAIPFDDASDQNNLVVVSELLNHFPLWKTGSGLFIYVPLSHFGSV